MSVTLAWGIRKTPSKEDQPVWISALMHHSDTKEIYSPIPGYEDVKLIAKAYGVGDFKKSAYFAHEDGKGPNAFGSETNTSIIEKYIQRLAAGTLKTNDQLWLPAFAPRNVAGRTLWAKEARWVTIASVKETLHTGSYERGTLITTTDGEELGIFIYVETKQNDKLIQELTQTGTRCVEIQIKNEDAGSEENLLKAISQEGKHKTWRYLPNELPDVQPAGDCSYVSRLKVPRYKIKTVCETCPYYNAENTQSAPIKNRVNIGECYLNDAVVRSKDSQTIQNQWRAVQETCVKIEQEHQAEVAQAESARQQWIQEEKEAVEAAERERLAEMQRAREGQITERKNETQQEWKTGRGKKWRDVLWTLYKEAEETEAENRRELIVLWSEFGNINFTPRTQDIQKIKAWAEESKSENKQQWISMAENWLKQTRWDKSSGLETVFPPELPTPNMPEPPPKYPSNQIWCRELKHVAKTKDGTLIVEDESGWWLAPAETEESALICRLLQQQSNHKLPPFEAQNKTR